MNFHLTKKKECRSLTIYGWLGVLGTIFLLLFLFFYNIHGFLAVTKPVKAEILVVDGFLTGYAYDTIAKLIERDNYKFVIATGVELDYVYTKEDGINNAELSYEVLLTKGIKNCRIEKVPAGKTLQDRTFSSAIALRRWLITNGLDDQSLNLVSLGCHARRSFILFRKAFEGEVNIGVISIKDQSYNSRKWYKFSQGVRIVISETIGYTYNKLFFHPKVIL
jgi:hypothetical protein